MLVLSMVIKRTTITFNSALGANRMKIFTNTNNKKMKNVIKSTIVASTTLLFFLGFSATANAVVIDYNFAGTGGSEDSFSFTEQGLTVVATASYDGFTNSAEVHQNSNGLGVDNSPSDSNTIDGSVRNDFLTLTFESTVEAIALDFGNNSANDEYDFFVGTTKVLNNQETTPDGWLNIGPYEGTTFTLRATQNNDNFRLEQIRVNYSNTVVPEPTSLTLFGIGLAGIVLIRRKRLAS
ncbi:MAG: hypothetical protein ACJAR0_004207 [Candidatus Azotimanducaceae bacterium]|jgi:hypothetical protein